MKEETKNKIRRILNMQEYCPECGLEIPAHSYPVIDKMMIDSGRYIRCSLCGGPKEKEQ